MHSPTSNIDEEPYESKYPIRTMCAPYPPIMGLTLPNIHCRYPVVDGVHYVVDQHATAEEQQSPQQLYYKHLYNSLTNKGIVKKR